MKSFKQFLKESILDVIQPTFSPEVFEKPNEENPDIKEQIIEQILNDVNKFSIIAPILKIYVIGGILTKQYTEFSDIDVNILFDASEEKLKVLKHMNIEISGRYAPGTTHPINYYIINSEDQFERANNFTDNVYNIIEKRYIKRNIITPINVEDYLKNYKETIYKLDIIKAELQNDLIKYDHLKSIPKGDLENLQKMTNTQRDKVIHDLKRFVELGNDLIKARKEIFQTDMSPEEVLKYGAHNKLPSNVIYKMLEKHYYLDLIHKLDKILKEIPPLPYKELMKLLL
jgi:predicted nucleotidyltransferase